ncbi:MAG: serine/threonine-protein kinase, partial [Prosthecobacter sp.]|nr:serine/threonine-protein kinase [Prosthecobacter sp.]
MSDSSALPKSCPKCGTALPSEATDGLCPNCLMNEALLPTQVSDASKPKNHSTILAPEALAPFFPQYEILRMLGRGGMGAVYLARQISLNRLVAIKILPADLGESGQNFAERFKNEAQAMAQLSHSGIVAVYDFGQTTNGLLYIVMEYIEGTDVQLMLASQGRLHSAHAMAITAHVCDALQYAHACGIIHRDIKPSNIMVGNNGVVKVADFGLAKMSQGQTTGLTQSGMAMGTPHFMAPEALTLGSAVDQRADIYAVGVMLYQMLTGKLPQGMFEMPSFQVPGLDPRYDRIVARALRDDREMRYQAAAELRHDLDAILTQPVEKTTPEAEEVKALPPVEQRAKKMKPQRLLRVEVGVPMPVKKSSVWMVASLIGIAAVVAGGWFFFGGHRRETNGSPSSGSITMGQDTEPQPSGSPRPVFGSGTPEARAEAIWKSRWHKPGRLRATGVDLNGKPFDLHLAEPHADFVQVVSLNPGTSGNQRCVWAALRANGEVLWSNGNVTLDAIGLTGADVGGVRVVQRGGFIATSTQAPEVPLADLCGTSMSFVRLPSGVVAQLDLSGVWHIYSDLFKDGHMQQPDVTSSPKVTKILVTGGGVAVLRENGTLRFWNTHEIQMPASIREKVRDVIALGFNKWAVLCSDGRVLTFANSLKPKSADPVSQPAAELQSVNVYHAGPVSEIRSAGASAVLKRSDGRWTQGIEGTQDSSFDEVENALAKLHAQDNESFSAFSMGSRHGILWIEPEPPADTAHATPTPTTKIDEASIEHPFENTVGMKFVPVPITGGPTDKQRVLFSVWDTRVQDYEVFVKESGRLWPKAGFEQGPTHPAINITWDD